MQRWDYACIHLQGKSEMVQTLLIDRVVMPEDVASAAREQGASGWELVSITPMATNSRGGVNLVYLTFKRPL